MRTFTKVLLIISGVLAAVGLALCIVGVSLGVTFSDIRNISYGFGHGFGFGFSEDGKNRSYNGIDLNKEFTDIKSLKVDISVVDMEIEDYDGKNFIIEGENIPEGLYCEKEDDTLVIKDDSADISFRDNWDSPKIILYIPENYEFEKADFNVGVGNLQSSDFKSKEVIFECGVGNIDVEGEITKKASLTCGVGRIKLSLEGKEEDFNYNVNGGVGSIKVGSQKFSTMDSNKKIDNGASKDMSIDCGVGTIKVVFDN